jgi:hypothetical protein
MQCFPVYAPINPVQPLSATDAISPAWAHTRRLLLSPMRWQTLLKIGLVAAFAGVGNANFNINNFNGMNPANAGSGKMPTMPPMHLPALAAMASVILAIVFVLFLLWLAFFYLSSRLQFVLFDVVLRRDTVIGPSWQRYGPATWRWMGLRLLLTLAGLLLMLPILIPAVLTFIHAIHSGQDAQTNFAAIFAAFLALLAASMLVALLLLVCQLLLHSFGLPSMALEATPLGETVARVVRLMRAEPLQVFLFILMHVLLRIAIAIAVGIVIILCALIVLIPFGILGAILWGALHSGPAGAKAVMWCGIAILAIAYLAIFLIASFMCSGVTGTFFQAYSIYFLAGRYPLLGDILGPLPEPAPMPFYYPPPPPFNPGPPPAPTIL